jgi:hypothetical protein
MWRPRLAIASRRSARRGSPATPTGYKADDREGGRSAPDISMLKVIATGAFAEIADFIIEAG